MTRDEGSKRHMQDAVGDRPAELAAAVATALPALRGRRLSWVSPLAGDNYKEFKDGAFLDQLGLGDHRTALRDFWPSGGPNWDALATVDGAEGGAVLVEAKAHVNETPKVDRCGATDPRSVALIAASVAKTRHYLGVPSGSPPWTEHDYQIANRLAHLYWLNEVCGVPTWLVFIGFTASPKWPRDPLIADGWRRQVAGWLATLGVPERHGLSDRIGVATLTA